MTELQLTLILGTALSLIFTYFPGLKVWFDGLVAEQKAQVMAVGLLIVGASVTGLSCAGLISAVTCTQSSIFGFVTGSLLNAILASAPNQATYLLTKSFKKPVDSGVG